MAPGPAIEWRREERLTLRRQLREVLATPRTASSLARELGLRRGDIEEDLQHAIRSARAAGDRVVITPARCKSCGFVFDQDKLSKPGKCPACRGTRIYEPMVAIERE
jgi:predicted Zn-ribbon and HTH transcriptional regulator